MIKGFWNNLPRPIMALAPMADVTDPAFRALIAQLGKPDITFTEFMSADGLVHKVGHERLLPHISFTKAERPIVLQVFGSRPLNFKKVAALARELSFDGIDINMGCPDKTVEKQGGGAALIKNPKLAKEIILATKEAVGDLPVSIKTRIGYNQDELETWIPELLSTKPSAITIHARTRKEMSKVPARWEYVKKAVALRNELSPETLILGNGDVVSIFDAKEKVKESGADGAMLGRAIFGNPWLFHKTLQKEDLSIEEVLKTLIKHTHLYEQKLGRVKSFSVMKKHFKAYVEGFVGVKELRMKLMELENAKEVEDEIHSFLLGRVKKGAFV